MKARDDVGLDTYEGLNDDVLDLGENVVVRDASVRVGLL